MAVACAARSFQTAQAQRTLSTSDSLSGMRSDEREVRLNFRHHDETFATPAGFRSRRVVGAEVLGTSVSYLGRAIAAMAYRCKDLKIFNENRFSYLMRQMNARRIRKVEPLDDAFPVEKPSLLAESLRMIVERGAQTREQIEVALSFAKSAQAPDFHSRPPRSYRQRRCDRAGDWCEDLHAPARYPYSESGGPFRP